MSTQLWVTDLDGTLLRSDQTISTPATHSLKRMLAAGLQLTYATARSAEKSRELLSEVPFTLPAIVLNGAMLVDAASGEMLHYEALSDADTRQVIRLGKLRQLRPFLLGREGARDVLLHASPSNLGEESFLAQRALDPRLRKVEQLSPVSINLTLNFVAERQSLEALRAELSVHLGPRVAVKFAEDLYCPGFWNLEVQSPKASKGTALGVLCKRLGVATSAVTAFGDHRNDLELFERAGRSIAVGNAHDAAKRVADEVVETNDNDGVVRTLERHWLG